MKSEETTADRRQRQAAEVRARFAPAAKEPEFEDDGLESHKWAGDSPVGVSNMADKVYDQEPHDHYTERARRLCAEGDHDSAELWDRDAERVKVREAEAAEQDRIAREDGVVDITRHTEDTLRKVDAALFEAGVNGVNARRDLISAMQNAGILFREPAPDYDMVRESTEAHIREVYDLEESDMATMAEEPIEDRLTRAWLNGFREGFERRAYIGRPDHS